jgi:hypothetical protein
VNSVLRVQISRLSYFQLLGIANFAFDTAAVHFGLGRHFFYLTPFEKVHSMKYEFLGQPVGRDLLKNTESVMAYVLTGILSPMFGRLSFMVYLLNIIVTSKPKKWFIYGLATQHIIINVATIILIVVQCQNFATMWDPIGTPGKCWSPSVQADFGYFQGATNTVTDIVLTVMPITIIWKLQLAKHLKIALSVLLGLSSLSVHHLIYIDLALTLSSAMIASIIRTKLTSQIADRSDFTCKSHFFRDFS